VVKKEYKLKYTLLIRKNS